MRARVALAAAGLAAVLIGTPRVDADDRADAEALVKEAAFDLTAAIEKGMAAAGEGVPFHAELERDRGAAVYSIDVAQGAKTMNVVLDAKTGKVVEKDVDEEDHSKAVATSKTPLAAAITSAVAQKSGRPIDAHLVLRDAKAVVNVRVLGEKGVTLIEVDAVTGQVVSAGAAGSPAAAGARFTEYFGERPVDLGPTGVNPFFPLSPGHVLVLTGKEDGEDVTLTITVTVETKQVDGVETRVVEEREEKGGALAEVSRNFFAISKRTNSVYYFGEEVDIYKGGRIVSHEGAWVSGEKGAHYGLMMPGTLLRGGRYMQEVAPGVAMDRAEIIDLGVSVETPTGTYRDCLVTEESSALESGRERKAYTPYIGLVSEGSLRLVKVTAPK